MKASVLLLPMLVVSTASALAQDLYATAAVEMLNGTPGSDSIIVNRAGYIPGDTYDGGAGVDTLWVTKTMSNIDFPATNFNFSAATLRNIEVLAFNYMKMEMPGNVIFSSAQFGPGLVPGNLAIYGAWGDQDITVNLVAGHSRFDASGWAFKTDMASFGAVWGPYIYGGREVGGRDTIHLNGSSGNNTIIGTNQADIIRGFAGDDVLEGGPGDDVVDGGPGVDTASYARAPQKVSVNLALLTVQNTLGAGQDTLIGIENLIGSPFDDTLLGDNGPNTLEGGPGNDIVNGGWGLDTASYERAPARVTINLNIVGAQNTSGAGVDTLIGIENLRGSSFDDQLVGNIGPNVIEGGPGNDVVNGGAGVDTASYEHAPSRVVVNLSLAGGQNTLGAGVDTLIAMENILGSAFNDTLTGNGDANVIEGGPGNDAMNGGAGVDTASYEHAPVGVRVALSTAGVQNTIGAGWDTLVNFENLTGSAFDDTLSGNSGPNVIEGGLGRDVMVGGLGNDTFVFARVSDSGIGVRRDVVSDFVSGVDRLDLSRIDANTKVAGNQNFVYIGAANFTRVAGQLRFANRVLSGDVNGDGVADFEIGLPNTAALNPRTDIAY